MYMNRLAARQAATASRRSFGSGLSSALMIIDGKTSSDDAKMIGMTPAWLTRSGI